MDTFRVEHQITLEDESVVTMRGIVQVEDGIAGPPIFEGAERVTKDGDEFDYVPLLAERLEFEDFASKDVGIRAKQAEFRPEIILTERGRALFGAWVLANSIHCGRWRHGQTKLVYCSYALNCFLAERIRLFCAGHASDRGVFAAGIERALSVAATSGFPNEFAAMPLKGKLDFLLGLAPVEPVTTFEEVSIDELGARYERIYRLDLAEGLPQRDAQPAAGQNTPEDATQIRLK